MKLFNKDIAEYKKKYRTPNLIGLRNQIQTTTSSMKDQF